MGTPDGFKPKRMGEKWKRIIQPDGDSDSSLDCWDDNMNDDNGNPSMNISHFFRNHRQGNVEDTNDPRNPRPGPSTSSGASTSSVPRAGPDVLPLQINSVHQLPLNLTPSMQGLHMRESQPACSMQSTLQPGCLQSSCPVQSTQPGCSMQSASPSMTVNSQVSSTSSASPATLETQERNRCMAVLERLKHNLPRKVHFQDSSSIESRLQRMRERISTHRQHLLRGGGEPYRRPVGSKDPSVHRGSQMHTSAVLSSSIASLRSMMRCGNNPDWLKLSGSSHNNVPRNVPRRTFRWSVEQAGPSQDFTGDNWRLDAPPALQVATNNVSAPSTSSTAVASNTSSTAGNIPHPMETPPRNHLEPELPEVSANMAVEAETLVQDAIPEAISAEGEESSVNNTQEIEPDLSTTEATVQAANDNEQIGQPICTLSEMALNTSILSMLECPVCLDHMGPPIHQCRRGHLVCNNCRGQLLTCPTCRCRFTDLRNLALERIAELLHFPCKNDECGQSFKLHSKEEHELNCPWRVYSCMAQSCQWQGLHQSLLSHVQDQHSQILLLGDSHRIEMPLDITFCRNYVFSCWGEMFRANIQRGPNTAMIYGLAQYLGPVSRAANYIFTFKFEQKDNMSRCITYTRTMQPDNIRLGQVYQSGDSFSISSECARHFAGDARRVILHIKLEKTTDSPQI